MTKNQVNLLLGKIVGTILILVLLTNVVSVVQAADFSQNEIQAVVPVTGNISVNTTWTSGNVYYIMNDIQVDTAATLTIQGGAIVKFFVPLNPATDPRTELKVIAGSHLVTNATADNPVIFTSGRNDDRGGDTNGDGTATWPAPGDWDYVFFENWSETLENVVVEYGAEGLKIRNSLTTAITPTVTSSSFISNKCGLTLNINNSGAIQGTISNNSFTYNHFGLCTTRESNKNGQASPQVTSNEFSNNSVLPIFLNAASYPTYTGNTFTGYIDPLDRLGIGIGNSWVVGGTLEIVNDMPYVVITPMTIPSTVSLTLPAGLVMKFLTQYELIPPNTVTPKLSVEGTLVLNSTPEDPIVFTSYRDDSIAGDTNGDDNDTEPYAEDWDMVYFKDTGNAAAPQYIFQDLSFRYARNGLYYETTLGVTRTPEFHNIAFIGNLNGLHLEAVSNNALSRIEALIQDCVFTQHGTLLVNNTQTQPGVPIFLENTVQPTYVNNEFTGNLHPAIGVTGTWRSNASWTGVSGDGLTQLPYLVHGDLKIGNWSLNAQDDTVTLTLPAGSIVKFFVNSFARTSQSSLLTAGVLDLQSTPEQPIVFTSYYDDVYGGDTSNDSVAAMRKDWAEVILRHPNSNIHDAIIRFGDKAIHLENKTANPLSPNITNSLFEENENGLYLNIQSNGDIRSLISSCDFIRNTYGLTTFAKNTLNQTNRITGVTAPTMQFNHFEENSQFPIYLNGSATLDGLDNTNTFVNNLHRAIGLGGYHNGYADVYLPQIAGDSNTPFNGKTFPYVVYETTNFDWDTILHVDGGLVFKFNDAKEMVVRGELQMTTSAAEPNYFTSYRDDYYDDTNGTPSPDPDPTRGVWGGIKVISPATFSFSYSTIKWANQGLVLFQHTNNTFNMYTEVKYNLFEENKNGLTLQIENGFDILSTVANNIFQNNDYGLHTYTNEDKTPHNGTSNPYLNNNLFAGHAEFPIYLQGSSNPTYSNNTFTNNTHPAIALGGYWSRAATWSLVYDQTFGQDMPYVVLTTVTQELNSQDIIVPANTIIKFMSGDKYLYVWSKLSMLSYPGGEIIFTAYADDTYGGDIDATGTTQPARNAWKSVWFMDFPGKLNNIHDIRVHYATAGISLYYDGPANTRVETPISNAYMSNNHSCIAMVVGWRTDFTGEGNLEPKLNNITMIDNNYGLLTITHNKATGIVIPELTDVALTDTDFYPLFLGGTSTVNFVQGNLVGNTDLEGGAQSIPLSDENMLPAEELSLGDLDLVGMDTLWEKMQAGITEQPQSALGNGVTVYPDLYPAIGLAGAWNNSVELPQPSFGTFPYVVPGNFPLTVILDGVNYKPADDMTIGFVNPAGSTATVTVKPNSIFKLGSTRSIIVLGGLNLLSTPSQRVIFTSIKDDSAGGDTNRDGAASQPAKGNWTELRIASSSAEIKYTDIRYSKNGVHLYMDGLVGENISPIVRDSVFMKNNTGITLTAKTMADILAQITHNKFTLNDIHVLGMPSDAGKTGHLCVEAHQNDILGGAAQNGVENRNLNGAAGEPLCPDPAFDATYNYWDSTTGPTHATNPGGTGSIVSDRVAFNPWQTVANYNPMTYTIGGRVVEDTINSDPMPGVTITLHGVQSYSAQTDQDGYYQFDGLEPGPYFIAAGQFTYSFAPTLLAITLDSDALGVNFIGTLNPADGTFSIDSVAGNRPAGAVKQYCTFTVSLSNALPAGATASAQYSTRDGTALGGSDYVAKNGTLTFNAGAPLYQNIKVELKAGSNNAENEFFVVELKNPTNANFLVSVGKCAFATPNKIFLPSIMK